MTYPLRTTNDHYHTDTAQAKSVLSTAQRAHNTVEHIRNIQYALFAHRAPKNF